MDAHRGAALDPDHDHVVAPPYMQVDRAGDPGRETTAVTPVCGRVELLLDRPEAVQPRERKLGAGHLLDPPVAPPELLDERRVDARAAGAAIGLGILVEQAVGDERNPGHAPSIRTRYGGTP